jgi:hypothetical protein
MIPTKNPVQNYRSAVLNFWSRSSGANSSLRFPELFAMFRSGSAAVFEELSVLELLQTTSKNRVKRDQAGFDASPGTLEVSRDSKLNNYNFYFCFSQRTLS